ncbi:MAG: endolytic transglycosylase MltG [Alphaproteobacteria bacterium]|nr:endolytic transglycosylase MltG [Alphaproteobacteria bacterium]
MWRDRLITTVLGVAALGLAVAIATYFWAMGVVNAPGPARQPTTLIVAPGAGLSQIARQLLAAGVVGNATLFEAEARLSGQARVLKPGEYRFEPSASITQVLDKLVRHDVVSRFVTIPEGLMSGEIVAIIDQAEGLMGSLSAPPAEGSVLPETYRYEWGDDREKFLHRMIADRDALLARLWETRQSDLPIATPAEAVTLASIVEKETGIASERGRVAAVFVNRLRRDMRLQADPTVIYGLGGGRGRTLTRADLEQPTPYNTYVIDGLPPGPICHPGRDALAAVLNPPDTGDIYFVADGSGGHAFAATLAEHNRNVARWRKIEDQTSAPKRVETKAPAPASQPEKPRTATPKSTPKPPARKPSAPVSRRETKPSPPNDATNQPAALISRPADRP